MDQIDHKDEPGEYRAAVFEEIQRSLNFRGEAPADPAFFFGDWVCRFGGPEPLGDSLPHCYQSFFPDGSAPAKAVDGTWNNPKDRNGDGSLVKVYARARARAHDA